MFVFIVGVAAVAMSAKHAGKKLEKVKKDHEQREEALGAEIQKLQEILAVKANNSKFLVKYAKSLSAHLRGVSMSRKLTAAQRTQYLALATSRGARMAAAENEIDTLQSQLTELSASAEKKDRQLEELLKKHTEIECLLDELKRREEDTKDLHAEIERRDVVIAAAEREVREGDSHVAVLQSDIRTKNVTINRMMKEMQEIVKSDNRRTQERHETDVLLQELIEKVRSKDAQIATLNDRLENVDHSGSEASTAQGSSKQSVPDTPILMSDLSTTAARNNELDGFNQQLSEQLQIGNQGGRRRNRNRRRGGGKKGSFGRGSGKRISVDDV